MQIKKVGICMAAKTNNLANIRDTASTTRVLNLVHLGERYANDTDFKNNPLFNHKRLNQTIITKHTPRPHERSLFKSFRSNATKVIFPIAAEELQLGGQSIFVEEIDSKKRLAGFLGVEVTEPEFIEDFDLLLELSAMASFDPYLFRERVNAMGRKVSQAYFALSEADLEQIAEMTLAELRRLVELAFAKDPRTLSLLTKRLNDVFLNNESDEALKPLTMAMGLPESKHHETMFCWKGFIYYKWRMQEVMKRIPKMREELSRLRVSDATPADREEIAGFAREIITGIEKCVVKIQRSLAAYDMSFSGMVDHQRPADFQRFLIRAPQAFDSVGEALSGMLHIVSFWDYRFRDGRLRIPYDEAYDLLEDFSRQLEIYTERKAA